MRPLHLGHSYIFLALQGALSAGTTFQRYNHVTECPWQETVQDRLCKENNGVVMLFGCLSVQYVPTRSSIESLHPT